MLSSRRDGFTLSEVMVATATMGIVLFYVLRTFTTNHQAYVMIDQVSEAQQNTRAVASLLERDIRNAGYMVPAAAAVCGFDSVDAPDMLFVSDSDAILPCCSPPEPTGTALNRSLSAGNLAAFTSTNPSLGNNSMTVDDVVLDEVPNYDTDEDGVADSDFQEGAGAILVDVGNPQRGVACGFVTDVSGTSSISVNFVSILDSPVSLPVPEDLRLVPAHSYQVVSVDGIPRLERDGRILAKDVEDLQFAWYYDDDRDGQIDGPLEVRGIPGTAYNPSAIDGNDLREVRFNVISRTRSDDPRNPDSAGTGQARENRDTAIPGDDGRRRRVHTATVRVRNLSL
jgi:type II secretory pathway pseudopilin PulG